MAEQASRRVPFIIDIVSKCLCPGCGVQSTSQCVAGLKASLNEALEKNPLEHEQIPGVYCGAGQATCTDLDPSQSCLCTGCSVYSEYNLTESEPAGYFCREGASR